jgi:hypothetical protein
LRAVITATGAVDRVETLIAERTATALGVLDRAPIDDAARAELRRLVDAATVRVS